MKRTTATGSIDGAYIDRNTALGREGTVLVAEDRNAIQEEICAVIEASGQTLSGADLTQLLKAVLLKVGEVAETITGVKTFSSIPVLPATDPTTENQATRKGYVDGLDSANVKLTGAQTVAGVKTFSSIPVAPASDPTTDNQVARKKYVDDKVGALGASDFGLGNTDAVTFLTVSTGFGQNEIFKNSRATYAQSQDAGSNPNLSITLGAMDLNETRIVVASITNTSTGGAGAATLAVSFVAPTGGTYDVVSNEAISVGNISGGGGAYSYTVGGNSTTRKAGFLIRRAT